MRKNKRRANQEPAAQGNDPRISDAVALRRKGWSLQDIADKHKVGETTVRRWIRCYSPAGGAVIKPDVSGGPPPADVGSVQDRTEVDGTIEAVKIDRPMSEQEMMAACKLDPKRWIPTWYKGNVWSGFYKLPTGSHKTVRLYQSKITCQRVISEQLEDAILQFVRENVKPIKNTIRAPKPAKQNQIVSWGLWDAHIGSYAWSTETGADWDVDIACHRIYNSIDDIVEELRQYPIKHIIMPIGNDFMHFDSCRMKTAHGDHPLDTDTRYARVYLAALRCLSYMVERALEIARYVELLYVPGNHDVTSSFTLIAALAQRYRNIGRVRIDLRANPRKYRMHGGVLLGYDHGAECPPNRLAQIFSNEARDLWSKATCREIHVGHKHQTRETRYDGVLPLSGVVVRVSPALCNSDAWHHSKGFIGEPRRSVEAWRYDDVGCRGCHIAWARDDRRKDVSEFLLTI